MNTSKRNLDIQDQLAQTFGNEEPTNSNINVAQIKKIKVKKTSPTHTLKDRNNDS